MSPKDSHHGAGGVKSRWEISPEAPRKIPMNFFSAPGASGSVLAASRGASWSPVGAQEGRGGLQEPFWLHFGTIWASILEVFGSTLGLHFGHIRLLL